MSQTPTHILDRKAPSLEINALSPIYGSHSDARNRHRERKMNSRLSSSKSPRLSSEPVQNKLQIDLSPKTTLQHEYKQDLNDEGGSLFEKSKAIGSLEDVVGEEHYRVSDYLNNERSNPYTAVSNSLTTATSPNLVEIKARNSILINNELKSIRNQLLQKTYELPRISAKSPSSMNNVLSHLEKSNTDLPIVDFVIALTKNDFSVMKLIDRLPVSAIRQETVSQLQMIFQDCEYFDCILSLTKRVIQDTNQASTMFRDNKLSNRLIDAFMKKEADQYLMATLNQPLKSILASQVPFEVEPKYISEQESLAENMIHLVEMTTELISSIFNSSSQIPRNLKYFFYCMRKEIQIKYPNDLNAASTAITAFLILRFFNPAIMKASLKDMEEIERNTRKFILISKIIQKLANFQLFKEKSMICFNNFLEVNFAKMKNYLDEISLSCEPLFNEKSPFIPDIKSCCDLADTISSLLGPLYTFQIDTDLLDNINNLSKKLRHQVSFTIISPTIEMNNHLINKPLNMTKKSKSRSDSLSFAEPVSQEMHADSGNIQIFQADSGIMVLGQVPSISNSSLASFPIVSNTSISNHHPRLDSNSKYQADSSNLKEKHFGILPTLIISDIPNPGTIIPHDKIATQKVLKEDIRISIENHLIPVEQIGWKKRRSFWANVLIIVSILIVLGIGLGISYWKLYMGN